MSTSIDSPSKSSAGYLLQTAPDSFARRWEYKSRLTQSLQPLEVNLCSDDIAHWVNHWCYTVDPRDLSVWPFDLFPKQTEFLQWLTEREERQEDGILEKSRDVGATWLCCAFALHRWLFRDNFSAGFGSRKLELVDRLGDADSILEKIRYMLYGLPEWMRPAGYKRERHDNLARILNPERGSTITGEGGDQIGRGGRKSIYFVDEAAFLERPELVERSLSLNTRVRIDVSTPNGPGNPFAVKRHSGRYPVFTLHWKDDPRKNQQWYDNFKALHGEVVTAQEVDIDYTASIEGITIPAIWVRAATELKAPEGWINHHPIIGGLDIAEEGVNRSVFVSRKGPIVRMPHAWSKCNTTETAWRAAEYARTDEALTVYYDVCGVGAGVRGVWDTTIQVLKFQPVPVNTGESPTGTVWPDKRTSKELCVNLRAEIWWLLRKRFEKTYEYVREGRQHPIEELISLPECPELIAELSMPLSFRTDTGKIKIESKVDMRKRGVKSPDYADALCLAFHPFGDQPGFKAPDIVGMDRRKVLEGRTMEVGKGDIHADIRRIEDGLSRRHIFGASAQVCGKCRCNPCVCR